MTTIDVSAIWDQNCSLLSASQAELGDDAGRITWRNCLALAERLPLVTKENRESIRDHFREYGVYGAWTDVELSALVWQEAAASFREFKDYCAGDLATYERDANEGRVSGRLWLTRDPNTATFYLGI